MYTLQTLNEFIDNREDVSLLKERETIVNTIYSRLDEHVSREQIESVMVNELFGIGKLFKSIKGIIENPAKKRKVAKLVDELIQIRVDIVKTQLNENPKDLDDLLDADDKTKRKKQNRFDAKVEALQGKEQALEQKMDAVVGDSDRIQKYVDMKKIEARIKANSMVVNMVDGKQSKILKKYDKQATKAAEKLADSIEESVRHEMESEARRGDNHTNEARGDSMTLSQTKIDNYDRVDKAIEVIRKKDK